MRSLETAQIVGIASIVTAVTALILNNLWNVRSRREASIRDRRSFNAGFRTWADRVMSSMSLALHLWCAEEPIPTELLAELSAEVNQGRLFFLNPFPEIDQSSFGFPGLRPRMLDCIYYTYAFIQIANEQRDYVEDREILFGLQVRFVRDAQAIMALERPDASMEDLRRLLTSPGFLDPQQSNLVLVAAIQEIDRAKSRAVRS